MSANHPGTVDEARHIAERERDSQVAERSVVSRCICGWQVNFTVLGTVDEASAASEQRFEEHVASGDCPERRDADGNVVCDEY